MVKLTSVKEKLRTCQNQWSQGNKNPALFVKELKEEHACPEYWFKRDSWTIQQATFIYQNLDPDDFSNVDHQDLEFIISLVDIEHDIHRILENHIYNSMFYPSHEIKVKNFIEMLKNKNIEIPSHFPDDNNLPDDKILNDEDDYSDEYSGMKRVSMRKEIMRWAAQLYWAREKADKKPFTAPTSLAQKTEIIDIVKLINKIGDLKPVKGDEYTENGVDFEWFSDLFPGDTKPGPKPKT